MKSIKYSLLGLLFIFAGIAKASVIQQAFILDADAPTFDVQSSSTITGVNGNEFIFNMSTDPFLLSQGDSYIGNFSFANNRGLLISNDGLLANNLQYIGFNIFSEMMFVRDDDFRLSGQVRIDEYAGDLDVPVLNFVIDSVIDTQAANGILVPLRAGGVTQFTDTSFVLGSFSISFTLDRYSPDESLVQGGLPYDFIIPDVHAGDIQAVNFQANSIPEPSMISLMLLGFILIVLNIRMSKSKKTRNT